MTLDEAIKDREEVAEIAEKLEFRLCAREHRQLAEWLKELKRQREAWEKVKAEIKSKAFSRYVSNYDLGLCRALDVIDKHLREVTTDADRD